MAGFPGSVVTVDGAGKLGIGTLTPSQWTNTTNGINYNKKVGIGNVNPKTMLHISSASGAALLLDGADGFTAIALLADGIGSSSGIEYGDAGMEIRYNNFANVGSNSGTTVLSIGNNQNVGIGGSNTSQKLTVYGNISATGIGYFGTIIGKNLIGAAGSVVTVDGAGKLGIGQIIIPTFTFISTTVGITYTNDKVAIGTNTILGTGKFKVAGDGSMGGMVITSQSLINPISTSNTAYTTIITIPVYIPAGTNNIEFNIIGSTPTGNGDFQLMVNASPSAAINIATSTPTIGTPATLNVAALSGWQTLKINAKHNVSDGIILHGYTVIVKD